MIPGVSDYRRNHVLNELSQADAELLTPSLKVITLRQGTVLKEIGDEVEHAYFPHQGVISLLAVMRDGRTVETATIGNEGIVGAMAGLGLRIASSRAVVQTPVIASRIAAVAFRKAVALSQSLLSVIVNYNETFLAQVQATAACNALHRLDARFARCILQVQDRFDGGDLPLTQDVIGEMLGVRRSSVSETAVGLQDRGVIRYNRGKLAILDRPALEKIACECYELIKKRSTRAFS